MSSQMIQEWVSVREFARRCGRHHQAAQKAINAGKIPESSIRRSEQGRITAVELHSGQRAWLSNTLPTASRPALGDPQGGQKPYPWTNEQLGTLMGTAFAGALLPGCAMVVARHDVTPELALDAMQDLLLAVMFSTYDALGLSVDYDRPKVLFTGELKAAQSPETLGGVLARIASMAAEFRAENQLASQSE